MGRQPAHRCTSSIPSFVIDALDTSQGKGRHRCVACAYEAGLSETTTALRATTCAHGSSAPSAILSALPKSQGGVGRHKCSICAFARGKERSRSLFPEGRDWFPDQIDVGSLVEGAVRQRLASEIERSPLARARCIARYGCRCSVCGIHFADVYGDLGEGFIHVHHLELLADNKGEHAVDPDRDLRPVCPNCHAMLHQRRPPLGIEELRAVMHSFVARASR